MRRRIENLKFNLLSFIFICLLFGLGYWAFSTLESGSGHVGNKTQKELEKTNKMLAEENSELKRELELLLEEKRQNLNQDNEIQKGSVEDQKDTKDVAKTEPAPTKPATTASTTKPLSQKEILSNELQKLIDKKIVLKLKSSGSAVGTVQKFLNLYNKTSNKVDNDYGLTTVNAVKAFQKSQGLSVTGQCGESTYKKMISWLKK